MKQRISEQQMQSFSAMTTREFVRRLKSELIVEMAIYCEGIDLDDYIDHGIRQCRGYQIESELAVGRYIRLMLILGRDFDIDANMPWAEQTLKSKDIDNQFERVDELTELAIDHVRHNKTGATQ